MISHHNVIKMILLSRNVLLSHSWTALIFRCVVIAPRTLEKRGRINTAVFIIIVLIMVWSWAGWSLPRWHSSKNTG